MIAPKRNVLKAVTLSLCAAALLACHNKSETETETTYYLVRHAEKELDISDPPLTDIGKERAQALAKRLERVNLTRIYSTETRRTRDTAKPTAKAQGLDIMIYDGAKLNEFAKTLKFEKGPILIVGHSNTTPELAEHLSGIKSDPIIEATEYDRFYTVTIKRREKDQTYSTLKQDSFGKPTPIN